MLTDALGGRAPAAAPAPTGGSGEFVERMVGALLRITRAVRAAARSSTGRSTSAPTSSAASRAASSFEPREENPMIGYRGCYRYVREPELFALELDALARVREETPEPAPDDPVRAHAWELEACLELIDAQPARPRSAGCSAG